MSVSTIHEWRRPDCGSRCSPRSCDAQAHYAAGYAAGYAQAEADAAPTVVRTGRLVVDLAREVVTVDGVELPPTRPAWSPTWPGTPAPGASETTSSAPSGARRGYQAPAPSSPWPSIACDEGSVRPGG
jgi:hypothetical protein